MDPNLLWLLPILLAVGWILLRTLRRAPEPRRAEVLPQIATIPEEPVAPPAPALVVEESPRVIIRRTTPIEAEPAQRLVVPVAPNQPNASPTPPVAAEVPVADKRRFLLDTPEAAQEAIVLQEILGPPLCRRGPGGLPRRER